MNIYEELIKPFPESEIEWRVQSCGISGEKPWCRVLAYVQARAIQRRLDKVFGWDGWADEYRAIEGNMICRLTVKTTGAVSGYISKENGSSETQIEAFKGGISGALKRTAASGFGIGRYLYDLDAIFADCVLEKTQGYERASFKDKKANKTKYIYWKVPKLPIWALPPKPEPLKVKKEHVDTIIQIAKEKNISIESITKGMKIKKLEDLTMTQFNKVMKTFEAKQ